MSVEFVHFLGIVCSNAMLCSKSGTEVASQAACAHLPFDLQIADCCEHCPRQAYSSNEGASCKHKLVRLQVESRGMQLHVELQIGVLSSVLKPTEGE